MKITLRWFAAGALLVSTGLLLAPRAMAHDFWLEPSNFSPALGETVTVRLRVGEHFIGDPVARPPAESLRRFVLVKLGEAGDASGDISATLPGRPGSEPAGLLRPNRPGAYIVGFHGKPNAIELPAEKFNAYLLDEGLEAVIAARTARGQMNQPGREIYSRCAKILINAGPPGGDEQLADRALGFTLELIAEQRPDHLRAGEPMPLRLLHEGAPLAGALVVAIHQEDPRNRIALRTGADGRVLLPLARSGHWLVKAVHMRPAPAGSNADWESLWASLGFVSGASP